MHVQPRRHSFPRTLAPVLDRRLSVAPMLDWTDRHCRYFLRGFSPDVLLYTEMVTASAILRGDREKLLEFRREEHPVALQLGGCEPDYLAAAARYGAEEGYDEINLNCGCPSDKVKKGAFGACLMNEPSLVADCIAAMCEAVDIPVTVKMRIGTLNGSMRDVHDAVHRCLFTNRFANEYLADMLLGMPTNLLVRGLRAHHLAHHRLVGLEGDPDRKANELLPLAKGQPLIHRVVT